MNVPTQPGQYHRQHEFWLIESIGEQVEWHSVWATSFGYEWDAGSCHVSLLPWGGWEMIGT